MLLVGSVAAADVPELGEPETREDVRRRLGEAGCELVYSPASERWLARLAAPLPALEGHQPVLPLGTAELAAQRPVEVDLTDRSDTDQTGAHQEVAT